jgi:hypothetical protein
MLLYSYYCDQMYCTHTTILILLYSYYYTHTTVLIPPYSYYYCGQMYGGVEYSLNQFAGGWWLSQLYLLDPDAVTFQGDYWFKPVSTNITKVKHPTKNPPPPPPRFIISPFYPLSLTPPTPSLTFLSSLANVSSPPSSRNPLLATTSLHQGNICRLKNS